MFLAAAHAQNRKGAGMSPAPQCYLYIQTSILEGVNPPSFKLYVCRGMSRLRGIGRFWGLDNFSAERLVSAKNRDRRSEDGREEQKNRDQSSGLVP